MRLGLVVVFIGIVGSIWYQSHTDTENSKDKSAYILQGATKQKMIASVYEVGGELVREYKFIEALSVKMTQAQLEDLVALNPSIKPFADTQVIVSKKDEKKKGDEEDTTLIKNYSGFDENSNIFIWRARNTGDEPLTIEKLNFDFPKNNKDILNVWINNVIIDKLKVKKDNIKIDKKDAFTVFQGHDVIIEIEFEKLSSKNLSDYELVPQTASISLDAIVQNDSQIKFSTKDNEVEWTIANDSKDKKELVDIRLLYPDTNNSIKRIKVDKKDTDFRQNSDRQVNLISRHDIKKNKNIEVEIEFDSLSSVDVSEYSVELIFDDGSSLFSKIESNNVYQGKNRDTYISQQVNANGLHGQGITGYGVTVALIDTGITSMEEIDTNTVGSDRRIIFKDLIDSGNSLADGNGHGTHITSLIANATQSYDEDNSMSFSYNGIAPDADLVVVRAFDANGVSSYAKVLEALEYVYEYRDTYDIKVLNLSFSALPSSYYWEDPINQMVMRLWDAGVTVVAAAGNRGSEAMAIGVPGNTPYVITVGATSDNATPFDGNDDYVTAFSSPGPTYEGFVKPELVAPGSRIQGLVSENTFIRQYYSMFDNDPYDEHDYFDLSGTSQSTAITSGVIALMLQANPNLTPDDIKCRLIDTARAATLEDGELAFSIFQQGAGLIDAQAAVMSTASNCANQEMSITKELANEEHYIGPVRFDDVTESFGIIGAEGLEWNGLYNDSQLWRKTTRLQSESQLWRKTSFNSDSQLWRKTSFESNSQLWRKTSFNTNSQLWRKTSFNADSQLWRSSRFNTNSQLWRASGFNSNSYTENEDALKSDSIDTKWVDHE